MELTNGQKCPASFDLFDMKGKPILPLPDGTTVVITGGDAGGPTGVAQWVEDASPSNGHGMITTDGDNVGTVTISGTMTLADGRSFTGEIPVVVKNSEPNTAAFTPGEPVTE
jgi:hypothetical protein